MPSFALSVSGLRMIILPLFQPYEKMHNSVNCRTTAAGGAAASSHSATLDIAPGTAHTGVVGTPLAMAVQQT